MKRLLIAAAFAAATTSLLAADIGVSINIGQPGFYGRIDIGDYPQPRLLYRQPWAVGRVAAHRPPIYMHVPPGHAKNWRKHCREYDACGERVYFVQDRWYRNEYVPRYQERNNTRRDDRRDDRHDERGNDRRGDHDNGRGNDNREHGRNR